jgi:hypothetical protein
MMNSMFYIFNVSIGDREWRHALFLDGKWFAFNWDWYCDSDSEVISSKRADPALWDGCILGEIPAEEVKWVFPESDRDRGPYYTYLHEKWLKDNLGITLPD